MESSPAFLRYQRIKDEERMYAELSKCSCLLNQLQLMLDPNEPQHNDLIQMLIRTNPIRLSQKDSNEYADYYPKIFKAAWTILTTKRKELFKGE
jgi:hypothetical protein